VGGGRQCQNIFPREVFISASCGMIELLFYGDSNKVEYSVFTATR
jgi:hypothetical protein